MLGFQKNLGLRIDHVLLSSPLARRCTAAGIDRAPRKRERPSDHAPVWATLRLNRPCRAAVDHENLLNLYPALASLPAERLEALLQPAALQLPAGTHVFAEHQPCQGFPLLLAGSIKVVKQSASGRELMLYRVAARRLLHHHLELPARTQRLQRARHRRIATYAADFCRARSSTN